MTGSRGKRLAAMAGLVVATFLCAALVSAVVGSVVNEACNWSSELFGWTSYAPTATPYERAVRVLGEALSVLAAIMRTVTQPSSLSVADRIALALAAVVTTAIALLPAPAILGKPAVDGPPRSLVLSVLGAATLGGLLAVGAFGLFVDVVCVATASADRATHGGDARTWVQDHYGMLGIAMLLTWTISGAGWAFILRRAGGTRNPTAVDRWVRWLFAGTATEAAIAVPTLVLGLRRDSCACSWFSWWVLVAGTTAIVLLCGPAIILLRTREARGGWMRGACAQCGYPRRGTSGTCPECGTAHATGAAPPVA